MFSAKYYEEIKAAWDAQIELLEGRIRELEKAAETGAGMAGLSASLLADKLQEIRGTLAGCSEDEAQALTFLYSAMPLSDLQDYPASLFLAYAKHGVFLWNHGPFAGREIGRAHV